MRLTYDLLALLAAELTFVLLENANFIFDPREGLIEQPNMMETPTPKILL